MRNSKAMETHKILIFDKFTASRNRAENNETDDNLELVRTKGLVEEDSSDASVGQARKLGVADVV